MAGTGKSTIAYTLCQRLRSCSRLGASFFCSRNEENTRSRNFLVPTIVRQLLSAYKPLVASLQGLDLEAFNGTWEEDIDNLLVQPWVAARMSGFEAPPLVIVIDALDELEDNAGAQFIQELINTLAKTPLHGLKFLLTSRPHPKNCGILPCSESTLSVGRY